MITPSQSLLMFQNYFTGDFRLILGIETLENRTFPSTSINTTTDAISVVNTYVAGSRVTVTTTGTISTNLTSGNVYYVVSPTGSTLQLSETFGGTAIDFTDAGTGTYSLSEVSHSNPIVNGLVYPVRTVADAVRMEIDDYQGITVRPTVNNPTPVIAADPRPGSSQPDVVQVPLAFVANNTSGTLPVDFDMVYTVKGGSATPGNTTGTLVSADSMGALDEVPAGQSNNISVTLGTF